MQKKFIRIEKQITFYLNDYWFAAKVIPSDLLLKTF
jgi:hypothetical protein